MLATIYHVETPKRVITSKIFITEGLICLQYIVKGISQNK